MSDHAGSDATSTLRGSLHWMQPHRVSGWALSSRRLKEHLRIEILLDGVVVANGEASLRLDPLVQTGPLSGDHGFLLDTDVALPIGQPERIAVVAIAEGGDRLTLRQTDIAAAARRQVGKPSVRFAAADRRQHPVFVLGAARSGTSVMGRALRKTGRYAGHGEGHLIKLLPLLMTTAAAHYEHESHHAGDNHFTMLAAIPQQMVQDGLQSMFAVIARSQFPSGSWMDKTPGPEMIRAAPLLRAVWPNARFVFMQRQGIDNVESRRRKFPEIGFADHCTAWSESMTAWAEVREALAEVSVAVEQLEMARQPQTAVDQVGVLLELTPEERARMLHALTNDRPQLTSDRFGDVVDGTTVAWDREQRAVFEAICGEAMRRFGYAPA